MTLVEGISVCKRPMRKRAFINQQSLGERTENVCLHFRRSKSHKHDMPKNRLIICHQIGINGNWLMFPTSHFRLIYVNRNPVVMLNALIERLSVWCIAILRLHHKPIIWTTFWQKSNLSKFPIINCIKSNSIFLKMRNTFGHKICFKSVENHQLIEETLLKKYSAMEFAFFLWLFTLFYG